jgi:hypothetical protein
VDVPAIRLAAVGWKADAALRATGGTARALAPLTGSIYLYAGGTIVWLGRSDGLRHPRAMLATREPTITGDAIRFDVTGLHPWRPRRGRRGDSTALAHGARTLVARLQRSGSRPLGLGALLMGATPSFPLDRAVRPVTEVAAACDHDDPAAASVAADPLLGLGPGLTPSGDDFVGGVLFARCVREPARAEWSLAAARLVERARARTHPISVALLEDLATGDGYEPLHDLVDALAGGDEGSALRAVDRLGVLGHSSGWDMLTGFLVGVAGSAVLQAAAGEVLPR